MRGPWSFDAAQSMELPIQPGVPLDRNEWFRATSILASNKYHIRVVKNSPKRNGCKNADRIQGLFLYL
jgi:hypothetical protein